MITVEQFDAVEMRVGTVMAVTLNKRARKPAYKVTVDLGELGLKTSSAQITNYAPDELVGRQVVCVCNFEPIHIGDVRSEVRLLGSDTEDGCILLTSLSPVRNGSRIY
jgi:tRNA-binding protein